MSDELPPLAAALRSLLPETLTPEQQERFGRLAAIVARTVGDLPRARNEFLEPAAVFDLQVRLGGGSAERP